MDQKQMYLGFCLMFVMAIIALTGFIFIVLGTLAALPWSIAGIDTAIIVAVIFVTMYYRQISHKIKEIIGMK